MKLNDTQRELLVRHLDGRVSANELPHLNDWLRNDPAARAFLREIAEQSVMVAELERTAQGRHQELHPERHPGPGRPAKPDAKVIRVNFRSWQAGLAAAAMFTLLTALGVQFITKPKPVVAQVAKVTGSGQYFGARDGGEHGLKSGISLAAGDTLETRSCDAWIELNLRTGGMLTVAGQSSLRILEMEGRQAQFRLVQGTLWGSPASAASGAKRGTLLVQTPTLSAELQGAQFDIQTSATETMVRVNSGTARVRQNRDGSVVELAPGQQVAASLNRSSPLAVTSQPSPINYWSCDLWQVPEVILGKWLPPAGTERARLGAEPLLWPVSKTNSVMLYAVAMAAWKSTDHPVLLHSDSLLRIRGRTEMARKVRVGFSTQRMRGVFAGKFEVDLQPEALGAVGETWEVEIPLGDFRPLKPQLSSTPDGLELTDIYALTILEDAGLEINHIEIVPRP